ncbi:MAG TPA: DUF1990 domain-containing protein [Pyrinomonadaceae bacterium]|nr:DUF1990 domain-containing protein [Pyrinomonadaceae bacterium]
MFLQRMPSDEDVDNFISSQEDLPFTYSAVGATSTQPPTGFTVDHNRTKLGEGAETFQKAVAALRGWKHFDLGWVTVEPKGKPLEVGTTVAVRAHTFGFWSLSAARIVYTIDEEQGQQRQFGFAYGTLPDHVECGEERFMIEWLADNSVWYDIYAFSQPRHPLVRLGFPLARMLQKRFVKDSLAVMRSAAGP